MNQMKNNKKQQMSRSVLQEESGNPFLIRIILIFLVIIFGLFLFWSVKVELNEVVNTLGEVESEEETLQIQHPSGGIVEEIFVKEREYVLKGEPLFRLDDTILKLQIEEEELNIRSLVKQRDFLSRELDVQKTLYAQDLTTLTEYLSLERRVSDVKGNISIRLKKIERYQVLANRMIIYAPLNGTVHGLIGYGSGTVISPGETIFSLVPDTTHNSAKIKIPASRIGSVVKGQTVMLKFSSYNYAIFGGMEAILNEISPTTFMDSSTKKPYYQGIVKLQRNYLNEETSEQPILQGMTLNAEIRIGKKTLFEYLFLPIKASNAAAFKEP